MYSAQNKSVEKLTHYMCSLLDTPPNGQSCSTINSSICIQCKVRSLYFTGEGINDFTSAGHMICTTLWIVCVIVGVLGVFGNLLIVAVLKKRTTSDKGFDFLIKILAWFDMLCCVVGVITSTSHISYFGNWSGRGVVLLYFCNYSWIGLQFFRSASQYVTVTLTILLFLMVTFPFQSQSWFSVVKSRIMAGSAVIFAVLLSIPRSTSRYAAENAYRRDKLDIPSLRDLDYYMKPTKLTKFWYHTLGSVHYQIDFWGPLPILLIFNFLSYLQVRKLSKKRKELKMSQKRDLQAVKMFLPVVVVLVCLNLVPISTFVMVHFFKVVYREVSFTTFLSITLNSAVNFIVYYLRAGQFRAETLAILPPRIRTIFLQFGKVERHHGTIKSNESSISGSGVTNESSFMTGRVERTRDGAIILEHRV